MDDGEVELSDPVFVPNPGSSDTTAQQSASVDSTIDEYFKHTRTCTHTHTCNPPRPDASHTHTCYHTHTQVISSGEDTKTLSTTPSLQHRKPLGNREAVRKYREKKKAHTAYLEEEAKKLRLVNQQLVRELQKEAILEAEIWRLRALLADFMGKIDTELGSFPFQKHCSSNTILSSKEGDCGIMHSASSVKPLGLQQCQSELPCFKKRENEYMDVGNDGDVVKAVISCQENCEPASLDCGVSRKGMKGGSDCPVEAAESLVSTENQGQ